MKKRENSIILISGGARSGKSCFALSLAKFAKTPYYLATGWAGDKEMADRIRKHKRQRGKRWTSIEERFFISVAIEKAMRSSSDFIVVDCLTIWLSNMMLDSKNWKNELSRTIKVIYSSKMPKIVFVSNEVGSGIVPADKLSRDFRDAAGIVNRKIATVANEVYLCACGIPLRLK
jgi:adenosylcobinamide kinase/adenosylcobinamide-phosphate guanylyltransferase